MEEGGAGGSRIGTLLLLLRKFMLAVIIVMAALIMLSSIGVNIGPLIAGAGVVGLAIGFGAQTLVKDIIAGVFFLMDDAFRVERVRKIIKKKVYEPIMRNEELAPKLLDKIKSQGVREMDDSAMIMRVKYKTVPGEQFVIRKEVYRLMQEAFAEAGIEFAHRNVTVYMPPETTVTEPGGQPGQAAETGPTSDQKLTEKAAAAAAIAVAQAEADEQKPK